MYDLPDSILGSLRSLRPGIAVCLLLLLGGAIFAAWMSFRGDGLREVLRAQAQEQVEAIYQGRAERAQAAADDAWQVVVAQPGRIVILGLVGLVVSALLVGLGCRGMLAVCWSLLLATASVLQAWLPLAIAVDAPRLGGLVPAQFAWALPVNGAWVALIAAYLTACLAVIWRLLTVPAPGRDDMSTFVEL